MSKIRIKNFGPINQGLIAGDGFIDITKITMFIGDQGSGKSSVAKLISAFSWLEKALHREEFSVQYIRQYNRFKNQICKYHNIVEYFREDTILEYKGDLYFFRYIDNKLEVDKVDKAQHFVTPQIMYIPSERNFLSVIENAEKIRRLPSSLQTFFEEYNFARKESTSMKLPIGELKFHFDRQNKITSIIMGNGKKLRLSQAASGFQSYIPLYLVTKYLSERNTADNNATRINELSLDTRLRIQERLTVKAIKPVTDIADSNAFKEYKANLEQLLKPFFNNCFINIVEEPEQNLYPQSQQILLYELMRYANKPNNKLVITTHSPYMVNALSVAAKAYQVSKTKKGQASLDKIAKIVPLESLISPDDMQVYQLQNNGDIEILNKYDGILSDNNFLNQFLRSTNYAFSELLEIEE